MLQQKKYSLLDAPAGSKMRVLSLSGGNAMRSRLYSLGIMPGTEIEIFHNCCCGSSRRISVRGSALVLGAGMAEKIICDLLVEGDTKPHTQNECICSDISTPSLHKSAEQ